ncbi:MAG: glycoside hydrolase family 3 N-terminal domain-containing protein, partial [Bdellovibrionales bacterium]
LLIVEIPNTEKDKKGLQEFKNYLKENYIGGVAIYGNVAANLKSPNEVKNFIYSLQSEMKTALFIAVDQEGGTVQRLGPKQGFDYIPSPDQIGDTNSSETAYKIAKLTGDELAAVGVNLNFGPVLDVKSNPNNSVITNRALSNNPQTVARLGIQVIKGLESSGILATVKHFPGHGGTKGDPHRESVSIDATMDELSKRELVPFKKAVVNGVSSIMVGHIQLTNICQGCLATFNKKLLTELLREQWKYDGLIITDDLSMGAIINKYDIKDASVKAILAGNDILLTRNGLEAEIIPYLCEKSSKNDLMSRELSRRINESYDRVMKAKRKHHLTTHKPPRYLMNVFNKNNKILAAFPNPYNFLIQEKLTTPSQKNETTTHSAK